MGMVKKRERYAYAVQLPFIPSSGIRGIEEIEIVESPSPRGATSKAIARKLPRNPDQRYLIGQTMNLLDNNYGGAHNYAYEIPVEIVDETGRRVPRTDPNYRSSQLAFLATQIAEDRADQERPSKYIPKAREILDAYQRSRTIISPKNQ